MTTFTIQNPVDLTATHPDSTGQHIFLTEKLAAKALLCSPVHFRKQVANGTFPQPVRFSQRKRFWIQKELEAFISNAIAARGI
jgi:predicted DNA-binding transcriptional regulator AlpA